MLKIPKNFTFPSDLEGKEIYNVKSFPQILRGVGDSLGFFGRLLSDQFNEHVPEFQRLVSEWPRYSKQEKIAFLGLILKLDEKMNKQKYVPLVVQRLMTAHTEGLPLAGESLSSQHMEDGFKKFLEYVRWGRSLAPETSQYIQNFLAHPRCEAMFLY